MNRMHLGYLGNIKKLSIISRDYKLLNLIVAPMNG